MSPFKAEFDAAAPQDPRRGKPSPHVKFAKRVLQQTYRYDWLGNNIKTGDDANGFYDRSLGTIGNGTANAGPYQLKTAINTSTTDFPGDATRRGQLSAKYDAAGNLTELFVQRNAALTDCLGPSGLTNCTQAFKYTWDELGRLVRARRYDNTAATPLTYPTVPTSGTPAADLRYAYDASDSRVLKTATDAQSAQRHTAYIFPSLELRSAQYNAAASPNEYQRDATTEVGYLFANGARLARLVNEPLDSANTVQGLRVFIELGDHLGSHSVAIDKETSELAERSTFMAYGGAESSYRPDKWGSFREDYRFTGKEEDVEVGLTYFGKRFYSAALQRWVSADPLGVHEAGADPNLYAYVGGRALQAVDPLGLEVANAASQADREQDLRDKGFFTHTGQYGGGDKAPERAKASPAPGGAGQSPTPATDLGQETPQPGTAQAKAGTPQAGAGDSLMQEALVAAAFVNQETPDAILREGGEATGIPGGQCTGPNCVRSVWARVGYMFSALVGAVVAGGKADDVVKATKELGRAVADKAVDAWHAAKSRLKANATRGKAFEDQVASEMEAEGWTVAREVTLESPEGGRTRMDIVGTRDDSLRCVECKSSATAPLRPGQVEAHRQIETQGATVMGEGKPSVPGGTKIAPTQVEVRRP